MKKYLFNGAMALIVGGFIVSCTHDDVGAPATVNDRTKSFDEMFTELYGPIAENHNWGFATVAVPAEAIAAAEAEAAAAATTRAATRAAEGYVATTNATLFSENWNDDKKYVTAVEGQTPLYRVTYTVDETNYPLTSSPEVLLKYMEVLPENQDNRSKIASTNKQEFVTTEAGPITYTVLPGITSGKDKVGYYYYDTKCNIKTIHKYVLTNDIYNTALASYDNLSQDYRPNGEYVCTYSGRNYKTFSLIYVDENGNESTTFPAGINVGFFVENSNLVQGTAVEMYSKGSLNSQISGWLHTNTNGTTWAGKTFENTATESHVAIFSYEGYNYVGFEDWVDYDYNDVILSVEGNIEPATEVKNEDTTSSNPDAEKESKTKQTYTHKQIVDQGRVFCEDIATANMKVTEDIDYNDIVFDARVWQIYDQDATTINNITSYSDPYNYRWQYDISLLATGGTIEEKIHGENVHNKFGVGQSFMVNTWTPNCVSTLSGQWNTPTNVMQAVDFSYTLSYKEVDPNNIGINTIPIEVHYGGKQMVALENRNVEERTSEDGNKYIVSSAPYKLCLPVGTQWPIERANIQSAYPDFTSYVSSPENLFYKGTPVPNNLYTQAPESSIQKDGKTTKSPEEVTQSGDAENSNVWVVWKGDVSTDGSAITLYNFTFQSGQTLRFFGSGTITVVCGERSSKEVITNGSMSAGYVDVPIYDADEAAKLSQGIFVTGSNFTLTKIVVL